MLLPQARPSPSPSPPPPGSPAIRTTATQQQHQPRHRQLLQRLQHPPRPEQTKRSSMTMEIRWNEVQILADEPLCLPSLLSSSKWFLLGLLLFTVYITASIVNQWKVLWEWKKDNQLGLKYWRCGTLIVTLNIFQALLVRTRTGGRGKSMTG